jgi:hypothetical protein
LWHQQDYVQAKEGKENEASQKESFTEGKGWVAVDYSVLGKLA